MSRCSFIFTLFFFGLVSLSFGRAPESGDACSSPSEQKWLEKWPVPESLFSELRQVIAGLPENAPSALILAEDKTAAAGQRLADHSHRLPRMAGSFGVQREAKTRGSLDQFIYRTVPVLGAEVTQPLFHWGALKARSQMGDLRVEAAQYQYEGSMRSLVLEVRRRYLDILILRARLAVLEQNCDIAAQNHQREQSRYQHGESTRLNVDESLVVLSEVKSRKIALIKELQNQEYYFRNIAGWDGPIEGELPLDWEMPERLSELIADTFLETNQIHPGERFYALERERKFEKLNYKVINARLLPIVNARGGVYESLLESPDSTDTQNETNFFVGVNVEWRVFDGFETKGLKLVSKARSRRLAREARWELERRELEVVSLVERIGLSVESIALLESRLSISNAILERKHHEYADLRITSTDYLSAKLSRDDARLNLLEARVNLLYDSSMLLSYVGQDPALLLL
jgi:outer membrane protein TolC